MIQYDHVMDAELGLKWNSALAMTQGRLKMLFNQKSAAGKQENRQITPDNEAKHLDRGQCSSMFVNTTFV